MPITFKKVATELHIFQDEERIHSDLRFVEGNNNSYALSVFEGKSELLRVDARDHSVIVIQPTARAVEVSRLFGTKQFLLSTHNPTALPSDVQLGSFGRLRKFSMDLSNIIAEEGITTKSGHEFLKNIPRTERRQFYEKLAALYDNQADYIASKHSEAGDNPVEDKFCRFNSENIIPLFMFNSKNEVIGFIRMHIIKTTDYGRGAYFCDEVVLHDDETQRKQRLGLLFNAARDYLHNKYMADLDPNSLMIIVARDREEMYEGLGCSTQADSPFKFIGGPPTPLTQALKAYYVDRVQQQEPGMALSAATGSMFRASVSEAAPEKSDTKNENTTTLSRP